MEINGLTSFFLLLKSWKWTEINPLLHVVHRKQTSSLHVLGGLEEKKGLNHH